MQEVLHHIQSIKGVIGSLIFNEKGEVLSHSFPSLIDTETVQEIAGLMLDCMHGLQVSETLELMDLRYNEGRIIIKPCSGILLCLLCTRNINLQMLNITLSMAAKRLERCSFNEPTPAEDHSSIPASDSTPDTHLRLPVAHLANKEAATSFDSLGMIAVSQNTSSQISDFYGAPFKKLSLINDVTGTSGTFPVMVMHDMDAQYDGSILVGPGIEKKLKLSAGDKVEVRIE
ncbi:MAG: hypothetical protein A2X80_14490 [Geobacteraceae bacterium GWB2_52_12]|nr:MAG: hypothetical protein A2X80_14490 [Geobacteraceae bacterium GWB2_52_12]